MKIKILLLMSFVFVGAFQQLNSMNYTLACKNLGIRPDMTLKMDKLNELYNKRVKETPNEQKNIRNAWHEVAKVYRHREEKTKNYKKAIIKRVQTGLFTQQISIKENDIEWTNEYKLDVYDYKRIFGALGILGTTAAGLAYWFRNDLGSLFNPFVGLKLLNYKK